MTRARTTRGWAMRGFNLVELVVALGIILALTAIAMPTMMTTWQSYRLSSVASNLSELLQRARFTAVQRNTNISALAGAQNGRTVVYIDLNGNGAWDVGEPMVAFPDDTQFMATGGGVPGPASTGFPAAVVPNGAITFNSRGTVNFVGAATVYISYLGNASSAKCGYRAVTVTPMGQVKAWTAAANGGWHVM